MEVGGVRVGVRANTVEETERLARALRHLRVTDPDVPPNLSVRVGDGRRTLHVLWWGTCFAARTGDPQRLVRAIALHAGTHGPPAAGTSRVEACAVVGPRGAVVLPASARTLAYGLERHLWPRGAVVLDAPWIEVDERGSGLQVADPEELLAGGDRSAVDCIPTGRREPMMAPGHYPIRGWFVDAATASRATDAFTLAAAAAARGTAAGMLALLRHYIPRPLPSNRIRLRAMISTLVS